MFGTEPIIRNSYIHKIRVDQNRPNWFKTYIHTTGVADESHLVQWGQQDEYSFYDIIFTPMLPSTYKNWPIEGVTYSAPDGRYKFSSIALYLSQD